MKTKVQRNPESIYVGSDFKKIGKAFELNRERVQITSQEITRKENEQIQERIANIDDDGKVDESEKETLKRELARIENDFSLIRIETRDTGLADNAQWDILVEAYTQIHDLMYKIVNSVGVYEDADVYDLNTLYKAYLDAYDALETLIFSVNTTFAKTNVVVDVQPNVVPAGTDVVITLILDNNGTDNSSIVSPADTTFGLSGVSDSFAKTMVSVDPVLFPDFDQDTDIVYYPLTDSVTITNCKQFTLSYSALTDSVNVNVIVRVDTDSIHS